ncbi:UDP-N-acetylmuramoyl-L-alanine--D-glutamate ligase [Hyphobacterium sp. HN65]|uniref:UDP-N-acetylmuramoylalanine--D-glutamate ligase n=1 Tax=Hyphobacterium lacteum TaxID=3116575 RepID=A0ABU7LQZ2_9PROT|nr:UDP-N-acetylmuramoyl-L-alanine--D-glutamate ligase [Hyphobacterium sp. HN65]MEE2526323.1 UDP-N-acetylmuramoyl-L-alanine--D-glutamate ligase [Hyphobacterium sp. HN65]
MIPVPGYEDQAVAVFGLGRSGRTTCAALAAGGARVLAWDDNSETRTRAQADGLTLTDLDRADWSDIRALVLSPGVPLTHPEPHRLVKRAAEEDVPVIGDMELFAQAMAALPEERRPKIIGITGTNGKSTTTALIGHILKKIGRDYRVGGNIGVAILGLEPPRASTVFVIELSSYQLDLVHSLRCNVAIWLNLTPDHLDRHGDMAGYKAAKFRIFNNQTAEDAAIIGIDDDHSAGVMNRLKAGRLQTVIPISSGRSLSHGVYALGGKLRDAVSGPVRDVLDLDSLVTLPGAHNAQNVAAAYAAVRWLGVPSDEIADAIETFPGLAHRLELVGTHKGIRFINDSKATNAEATAKALASFDHIYWIAGGRKKEGGIGSLAPFFPRIEKAYLIGEAAGEFAATLSSAVASVEAGTLENALDLAARDAGSGGRSAPVILLSPACASFDQFRDFEHRGDVFRMLVKSRIGNA